MPDKDRELALAMTAQKQYAWFPPGELVPSEKPDILLIDGDDRVGIEVTELFQPPKYGSRFGPHVVLKTHRDVMRFAERKAQSIRPADVLVYFDYRMKITDAESAAAELVQFVRTHQSGTYTARERVPHGFDVVRIAEPIANVAPRWRSGDSGETLEATRDLIEATIAKKNTLVSGYRATVPRVWLLIACAFADFANNFYVRDDVKDWRFDFDFDKVLLLTSEQGVFELLRRPKP